MSEHARRGGCPATGKAQYWSRREAKDAIKRHHHKNMMAYKCDSCRFFHVGGRHGETSRIAHREGLHTTPIPDAARMLGVTQTVVRLIITSGKARGNDTSIHTDDLNQLIQLTWRQT